KKSPAALPAEHDLAERERRQVGGDDDGHVAACPAACEQREQCSFGRCGECLRQWHIEPGRQRRQRQDDDRICARRQPDAREKTKPQRVMTREPEPQYRRLDGNTQRVSEGKKLPGSHRSRTRNGTSASTCTIASVKYTV